MGRAWAAWWLFMPVLVFIQWPAKTITSSVSISWAAWGLAAGVLSCLESGFPRRRAALVLSAPLLLLLFLNFAWKVFPTMKRDDWVEGWGVISSLGSSACWASMVIFGTISALRYSPSFKKMLAPTLFVFHSLSFLVYLLDRTGIWKFWKYSEIPVGLISHTAWLGLAVISLPILWEWRKWAIVPALAALFVYNSFIAVSALSLGLMWSAVKSGDRMRIAITLSGVFAVLAISFLRYSPDYFLSLVLLRLRTWEIAALATVQHPFGLGWNPFAFESFIKQNNLFGSPIIPHYASDVLKVTAENGWITIPFLAWIGVKAHRHLKPDGIGTALTIAICLALIQRSMSIPYLGIFAWAIWLLWNIDRLEESPA